MKTCLYSKMVRYLDQWDLHVWALETLRPLVAPSLHSDATAQGLRVSKAHRSHGLGI